MLAGGVRNLPALITLPAAGAVAATCLLEFVASSEGGCVRQRCVRTRRRYGAYLAHLGLVVVVAGIAVLAFLAAGEGRDAHPRPAGDGAPATR